MSVGVALTSSDGGTTWTSQRLPAGVADLSDISCTSSSDCMAAGYGSSGGMVVTTTDGGRVDQLDAAGRERIAHGHLVLVAFGLYGGWRWQPGRCRPHDL